MKSALVRGAVIRDPGHERLPGGLDPAFRTTGLHTIRCSTSDLFAGCWWITASVERSWHRGPEAANPASTRSRFFIPFPNPASLRGFATEVEKLSF